MSHSKDDLYYHPYDISSNKLYIALVLSPDEHIGKNIEGRLKSVVGSSVNLYHRDSLGRYDPEHGTNLDPHVSLLSIDFPIGEMIDGMIKLDFDRFVHNIASIIKEFFAGRRKRLYSSYDSYEFMGDMVARVYDSDLAIVGPARVDLTSELLTPSDYSALFDNVIKHIISMTRLSSRMINGRSGISPARIPKEASRIRASPPTYTYYTELSESKPLFAVSSDTTNFKPHVSIYNTKKGGVSLPDDRKGEFIDAFKGAAKGAISLINLWSGHHSESPRDFGNISHIFVAYGKNKTYIPF